MRNGTIAMGNPKMDKIVGVVSFGDTCEEEIVGAAAHTQVNRFLDWINSVLKTHPDMCEV